MTSNNIELAKALNRAKMSASIFYPVGANQVAMDIPSAKALLAYFLNTQEALEILEALYEAGVDNREGYADALQSTKLLSEVNDSNV